LSAFDSYREKVWPFAFEATVRIRNMAGGIPSDPRVAEGWIRTKLGETAEDQLQQMVAQTMLDRGVSTEEATKIVNQMKNLNGFKRLPCGSCPANGPTECVGGKHELYHEGRQWKSAIKEAVSVAVASGKLEQRGWGATQKWIQGYVAEHVFVAEEKIPMGIFEPDRINQRFVSTHRGTGIQYEEIAEDITVTFTVETDVPFTEDHWAAIFLTGEKQGIGASRSQGFGLYKMVGWEQVRGDGAKVTKLAAIKPSGTAAAAKGKGKGVEDDDEVAA